MERKKIEWPGWETVDIIGRGNFGEVYEIQRTIHGRTEKAALKVIRTPKDSNEIEEMRQSGYDDESLTRYFTENRDNIESEYSLMADMKGHSNIVYCDDIISIPHEDGYGWDILIKMELLTPLKGKHAEQMTEGDVIKLGKDICNALIFCEKQHVIHRDIKPENIFVSRDGSYKLGDFGIAKIMEGTVGGTKVGTYDYMSPEVYNNRPYGTKADMYSLGIVLYWALNEYSVPFQDKRPTAKQKEEAQKRRFGGEQIPLPKNGSDELKAIVLKACAFDPRDRFANAQEMLDALQNIGRTNPKPITAPVDLDVHREMTFEHANHPAGKHLSIQVDSKAVYFSVPTDIKDGQTIHLKGKGKYDGATGTSGDLYITVHIKAAPPQPRTFNFKIIYIAIAAVVVILAIILMIPKNKNSTALPNVNNNQISVQGGSQNSVTPSENQHNANNNPQTPQNGSQNLDTPSENQHKHNWIDATYDAPKTCATCGETEGTPKVRPVYINELDYYDKYGKVYYHDNQTADYDNNLDWRDLYTPGHIYQAVRDGYGTTFTYGLHMDGDQRGPYYITYNIDSKYTVFSGWCVLPDYQAGTSDAKNYSKYFEIYCDGKCVFTSNTMKDGTSSQYFEIDVTDVDVLTIQYAATTGPNDLAVLCDGMLS